jgi:hypothetical protein
VVRAARGGDDLADFVGQWTPTILIMGHDSKLIYHGSRFNVDMEGAVGEQPVRAVGEGHHQSRPVHSQSCDTNTARMWRQPRSRAARRATSIISLGLVRQ